MLEADITSGEPLYPLHVWPVKAKPVRKPKLVRFQSLGAVRAHLQSGCPLIHGKDVRITIGDIPKNALVVVHTNIGKVQFVKE